MLTVLTLYLLAVMTGGDEAEDSWEVGVEYDVISIDGYREMPGDQGTEDPVADGDTPVEEPTRALTVEELCARHYRSNTGVEYYETPLMSGPFAEYCRDLPSAEAETEPPQPTLEEISWYIHENAQEIISSGEFSYQPATGWALVNKEVYLASAATQYSATLTVLDTPIEVLLTPREFHWDLGNGVSFITEDPGGPYPHGQVRGVYTQPGTYTPQVTISWQVQARAIGGDWYTLEQLATTRASAPPLQIVQAEARLTN